MQHTDCTSAKVIEDIRAHCHELDRASTTYFYIDRTDLRSLSMNCLCRSIVSQLLTQNSRPMMAAVASRLKTDEGEESGLISTREWLDQFRILLQAFDRHYIVLDILDEGGDCTQLGFDELSDFIKQAMKHVDRKVNVIVFSRDLEQRRSTFKTMDAKTIEIDGDALALDMQTALRHRLSSVPEWPQSLKNTIETSLLGRANGS
jgi:hypothetical protein